MSEKFLSVKEQQLLINRRIPSFIVIVSKRYQREEIYLLKDYIEFVEIKESKMWQKVYLRPFKGRRDLQFFVATLGSLTRETGSIRTVEWQLERILFVQEGELSNTEIFIVDFSQKYTLYE